MKKYFANKTIPIKNKGVVNITKEFKAQVDYLCSVIPNEEWSGILFYEVVKGDVMEEEYVLKPKFILPKDKGTSGSTEYEFDVDIIDLYEVHPELEDLPMGHIHSHNNMGVFFSGTDDSELANNASNFDRYFSLIVNNSGKYCAKVGVSSKLSVEGYKKETVELPTIDGKTLKIPYADDDLKEDKEVLLVKDMECNIYSSSEELDKFFLDKVGEINKIVTVSGYRHSIETTKGGIKTYNSTEYKKNNKSNGSENVSTSPESSDFSTARALLYKILKNDLNFNNAFVTAYALLDRASDSVIDKSCSRGFIFKALSNALDMEDSSELEAFPEVCVYFLTLAIEELDSVNTSVYYCQYKEKYLNKLNETLKSISQSVTELIVK